MRSIPIEVKRIGISYTVRNEEAILPAVPKVVINENAIGPQEHAPADAPRRVPRTLELIFRVSLISLTRYRFNDTASEERNERMMINEKLTRVSG